MSIDETRNIAKSSVVVSTLTRPEMFLLLVTFCVWAAVLAVSAPSFGGNDVYCFRDPAINFLHREGFRTASYVLSESFRPVLYSINTPGSAWSYLPFGALFGIGPRSEQAYTVLLSILADIGFLVVILRLFRPGRARWFPLLLLCLSAPLGVIGSQADRPENLAFLLLFGILILLRRGGLRAVPLAGLLAGLAFLAEPVAGAWGLGLIAGDLWMRGESRGDEAQGRSSGAFGLATLCFCAPILVTIAGFYASDNTSLTRFVHHAHYVVGRGADGKLSEPAVAQAPGIGANQFGTRYITAYRDILTGGIELRIRAVRAVAILGIWLLLCVAAGARGRARLAMALLGVMLLVLPVIVFPMQRNYLLVSCCLIPVAVAWNWAGTGEFASRRAVRAMVLINLLVLLPSTVFSTAQALENRSSYHEAVAQAGMLRDYLAAHHEENGVVLVSSWQYYVYKPLLRNLYDPDYLTPTEDPSAVVAVVNCNTASQQFEKLSKPLPPFVAGQSWNLISAGQHQVRVNLFSHQIMSRNWTWACDVYARP